MAQLSVEQSAYSQSQQQYLANLKVGQFAKFLNKNPIFVTYYPVVRPLSRTDSGTGAIQEEIGPNSPVRYNKILELPVFNLPELKPDVQYDEGGYDIDMNINDIAFIAGTVRPKPGDYMLVQLARTKPILFRCNSYSHNTIQSNDYYMADFDLMDIDQEYSKLIDKQVEKTYTCKFENIGTENKVFVTGEEDEQLSTLEGLINEMTNFYNGSFYDKESDSFVLFDGNGYGTQWYQDNYLTRFINESRIFQNDASDYTVILPYMELLPMNFDMLYQRSLWYAVLKRSGSYLHPYLYAWNDLLQKRTSPLNLASHPTLTPNLICLDHYVDPDEPIPDKLKNKIWVPGKNCGWSGYEPRLRPYFPLKLIKSITSNVLEEGLSEIETMIYQYINGGASSVTYDTKTLIEFSFKQDMYTYMYMPIIIYILKQCYKALNSETSSS